ncbi:MAG: aminotransferase class I/II-fold pyridoxal phosphate-dependent enzyme, partial [Actinomycetia bacterium]|nr:aminotransferase class I/II-fold pyridoxal phosphate-dependent enzyme [Actinomycetes bacterium]
VLRTFSKIYSLAGARIGYGVVPAEILEAIDKVREPFNINTPAQVGAAASLDDQNEVNARSQSNQEQRKRLEEALDRLGMRRSESQTNFVYFNPGIPPMRAFETLKAEGLIVRVLGDNEYIRATLGTDQENTKLIKVLESLA